MDLLVLKRGTLERGPVVLLLLFTLLLGACASAPYEFGTGRLAEDAALYPAMEQQIYIGEPHAFLDNSGWIWPESLLRKLILLDTSIDNHKVSAETIAALERYLIDNELEHVQVLVNCYKPGNQWSRLFRNRTVGGGWRFTLGIFSVVTYTIMPGRFFGGDAYNPYTNTIYLYSDNINVALHEAGHAKDFARRELKGTHAAIYSLPFAPLYYEARASNDALSYLKAIGDVEQQGDAYTTLYPAYGTYLAANLGRNSSDPIVVQLATAIPAHIVGRIAGAWRPDAAPDAEERFNEEGEATFPNSNEELPEEAFSDPF